jgi:hypothetical protein
VGVAEVAGDGLQEGGGAGDGDGEDGVGEVAAVGDEGGLRLRALGAATGAQLLVARVAAADGVEVGVESAGPVDADEESQVLVAGLARQLGEGVEGVLGCASGAVGEHADQGGAGGVGGGVAVVEGGAGAEGGQGACEAQQQSAHAASAGVWPVASAAAWVRAPAMRASKLSCRVPRWVALPV